MSHINRVSFIRGGRETLTPSIDPVTGKQMSVVEAIKAFDQGRVRALPRPEKGVTVDRLKKGLMGT